FSKTSACDPSCVRFGVGSSAAPYNRKYRDAVDSRRISTTFRPAAPPRNCETLAESGKGGNGLTLQSPLPGEPVNAGGRIGRRAPNALRCIPTVSTFDTDKGPTATMAVPTTSSGFVNRSFSLDSSTGKR